MPVGVLVADHHLAGVDRDAQADRRRATAALLQASVAERLLHRDRGAHGAHGVVLGDARHAEGRHHAVAEQLHDRAAVRLDRTAHRLVVGVHHAVDRFRIEPLVQRRRADQVGEDDGDDLAFLASGAGARAGAGSPGASAAPHPLQNREPGGGVAPQLAQTITSLPPQPLQNADPAGGSWPQCGQVTM